MDKLDKWYFENVFQKTKHSLGSVPSPAAAGRGRCVVCASWSWLGAGWAGTTFTSAPPPHNFLSLTGCWLPSHMAARSAVLPRPV